MITLRTVTCVAFLCLINLSACATHVDLNNVREHAYEAYQNKDYATAADQFEVLVEKVPEDGEFWFPLGNSYARTDKPQLAIAAYQNALLIAPGNEKAWYNMGLLQINTALKTFVDMQKYADQYSPIGKRGEDMRQGLFTLLRVKDEPAKKE